MWNFTYKNPVEIVFGKGSIKELGFLIPKEARVLMTYGGGSIKKNGVYGQVRAALHNHRLEELGGIEPNPRYETLMKAVALARDKGSNFLLAVGGGSVLDGTKFIAAAIPFAGNDPWDILTKAAPVNRAVALGCVLTLPATGSEMNNFAVISREASTEKLAFASPLVYPRFSILDPETTFSLPKKQIANGIVDVFVHVAEQYLTYDVNAPLQDRQAEAILLTLIDQAPAFLAEPPSYEARANMMWCATQALNGLIGCGVPQDWTSHMIGHEITALFGLDHGQTLAMVLPAVLSHERGKKAKKLELYAERVWRLYEGSAADKIDLAITRTKEFFDSVGMATHLGAYGITAEAVMPIAARLDRRGRRLGEHGTIGAKEIEEILTACL